jgi:hypothetical protein
MANSRPEESWMLSVAEIMVKEDVSFRVAAVAIGKLLTPAECSNIERTKAFQRVLWKVKYRYFEDLGSDPARTKSVLLGQMVHGIDKLLAKGEYKEAVDAALKLAKVEYNVEDGSVNVFASLSQSDIDALKAKLKALNEPLGKEPN